MRKIQPKRRLVFLAAIAALTIGGAYSWMPSPAKTIVSTQAVQVGDTTRFLRLVVPQENAGLMPVVIAFHGIGDSPESMAEYSNLDRMADEHGFLVVYPAGQNEMWDAIEVDPDNLDLNPDVQMFDVLMDRMSKLHQIDTNRVYLVGMSNGASFAQLLAQARSPAIAGVVAHSGPRPRSLRSAEAKFPVLLIVGSKDSVKSSIQQDVADYQENGHTVKLEVVDGLGHEWSTSSNSSIERYLESHGL